MNYISTGFTFICMGCVGCSPASHDPTTLMSAGIPSYTNAVGMKFVRVPGGTAILGAPKEFEKISWKEHNVYLDPFWLSAYEVTNQQYELYKKHPRSECSPGDDEPVGGVKRSETQDYIRWLNKRTGEHYGLPSEAQWEYAARGGLVGCDYPWGNGIDESRLCMDMYRCKAVGSYPANKFGLYEMAGNIAEIVADGWHENDQEVDWTAKNPFGKKTSAAGVLKGLGVGQATPQVWMRFIIFDDTSLSDWGFRLILIRDGKATGA